MALLQLLVSLSLKQKHFTFLWNMKPVVFYSNHSKSTHCNREVPFFLLWTDILDFIVEMCFQNSPFCCDLPWQRQCLSKWAPPAAAAWQESSLGRWLLALILRVIRWPWYNGKGLQNPKALILPFMLLLILLILLMLCQNLSPALDLLS